VTGAEVERFERTGVALVDRAVLYWGQANLCPRAYRLEQKPEGATDWPNLVIAAASLERLECDPIRCLPDTYVVHGTFGIMYPLQVALAQRSGIDVQRVEVDTEHATVLILRPGETREQGQLFTVTMADARRAGWADRNPCYKTMPQKMLPARATTAAIAAVAPGVLRGIASAVAPVAMLDPDLAPGFAPPAGVGTEARPAPVLPAPAGYMTRPVPDALRAEVLERLHALEERDPTAAAELRREWKGLSGPVIQIDAEGHRRAFLPDVLVLRYMLDEIEGELAGSGVVEVDGPTPADVLDDAPESRGMDPDPAAAEYADDDPGRPF
jgi:hypothetical protein